MPRIRRCGLALLLVLAVACGGGDPAVPAPDIPAHGTGDAVDTEPSDEDIARLLRLDERPFPLLIWATYIVSKDYFDKSRFDPRDQLVTAARFIGLRTPEFFAEPRKDVLAVTVRSQTAEFPLLGLEDLRGAADLLEDILEFTQSILDLDEEPLHELEYTAINGLFASLDPHTVLLTPEQHADLDVRTKGEFGGIGAEIRAEQRRIVIVRVMPDRPAARAGVEAGDVILKIGRESTVNMSASDAQQLLRGPVGTAIEVTLRRDKKVLVVKIPREIIKIDSVIPSMLPGGIGYLQITNFQENTAEQVDTALQALRRQGADLRGVVFDLRGNSGGLLTQATEIVDQLVMVGDLVIVRSALGREADPASPSTTFPDEVSVVVLIDEDSASASEIVGGGLQALGRGVVVGRTSFGKGTVQMLKMATPYGRELALKVTVAEYLVAGDHKIQSIGVIPDLTLGPVEMTAIRGIVRFFDFERFERERERAKTANFPSARHDHPPPPPSESSTALRYLWQDALSSLEEDVRKSIESDPQVVDALSDPEIQVAWKAAAALAGTRDREQRARALEALAKRLSAEEDARIVAALAERSIDWEGVRGEHGQPDLEVVARVRSDGPVLAGDPFVVEVEITNRGEQPAHRVHLITDCVHDELDGIELVVGKIPPGETVKRSMSLHVMPWHDDFTDRLVVDVHAGEPDEKPDASTEVMFEIAGAPKPVLHYDYWIVDDPALVREAPKRQAAPLFPGEQPFEVSGNGDGLIQPGERVLLAFVAHNEGPGTSPDARALLRNLTGRQGLQEEGLVELGKLAPGQKASGAFAITVRDDADPGLPFELELIVADTHLRASVRNKLRFRVMERGDELVREPAQVRIEKEVARLYNGAHSSTPVVGEAAPGTRLEAIGTIGPWWVIERGLSGRRFFLPQDVALTVHPSNRRQHDLRKLVLYAPVSPPRVELESVPRTTSLDKVTIRGRATHPVRVHDVVVSVLPPGPAQIERKVHYAANPSVRGDGARQMGFEVEVPLDPGGNRISVIVRDGAKVERERDVWVFRR